ncbi:hypothetical protein TGRUB_209900A, partial [Toxoplasma gondii RUB]
MQRLKKKSTLPRAAHAGTGVLGGSKKRQEQYSISYEAYRHFAFFTALYLSVTGKPAAAPDVVSWYFKEKWYCIPSEIPKALTSRVYLRLVNNLIVDNCVAEQLLGKHERCSEVRYVPSNNEFLESCDVGKRYQIDTV